VLGPLEVRVNGAAVALGGRKQRALLALLLLHANEVVSRDRLIEGVWGERPPTTAPRSLDSYVSRLRKLLGADRIERHAPGYVFWLEPGELDLERFEALLRQGRAAMAAGDAATASDALRGHSLYGADLRLPISFTSRSQGLRRSSSKSAACLRSKNALTRTSPSGAGPSSYRSSSDSWPITRCGSGCSDS